MYVSSWKLSLNSSGLAEETTISNLIQMSTVKYTAFPRCSGSD